MRPVEGQIDDLVSEVNKEVDELMNKVVIDCMKENFVSYLERNK